jgi:hypothetical protein
VKTAIYIEDGTIQLVLTPENEFETNALRSFEEKPMNARIMAGSFYDCQGGWIQCRQVYGRKDDIHSLILRMDKQSAGE